MDVPLVSVGAVLTLELFTAHRAWEQVTRVQPPMLLKSDLTLECLSAVVTLECLVTMNFYVICEVAGGFESLGALGTLKVPSVRILMHCNLMFPHIRSCDGRVATIGTQMGLWRAIVGEEMLTQMTPTFVGLCTGIDGTLIETY